MRRWDNLLEGYRRECEIRGLYESTIKGRIRELEKFGLWLKRRRPKVILEEIDEQLLTRYIKSRTVFYTKSSVCSVLSILKTMGDHLHREGVWRINPLRWMRGPKLDHRRLLPKRIEKQNLTKLWEEAGRHQQEYYRYLWISILSILYGVGIRRGELERLNMDDWNREEGVLRIDGRKTGMERKIPVSESVWRCMEAYLPYRHNKLERLGHVGEESLFLNKKGKRMMGNAIGGGIHRLARKAGVPLVTLHQFRHTCASDLLEDGVGLSEIKGILGHAAIQSTCRYIQVADPERAKAMSQHPINDILGIKKEVCHG